MWCKTSKCGIRKDIHNGGAGNTWIQTQTENEYNGKDRKGVVEQHLQDRE